MRSTISCIAVRSVRSAGLEFGLSAGGGDLLDDRPAGVWIAAVHDHTGATPRQLDRDGAADEGSGAGDEGGLAVKILGGGHVGSVNRLWVSRRIVPASVQ